MAATCLIKKIWDLRDTTSTANWYAKVAGINLKRETLFVKVKNRHFRREKCLDSVVLDILSVRRDLIDRRRFLRYPSWIRRRLSRESYRGLEILYAERRVHSERARADIVDCWWTLFKKILETALAFFSCFANWLVTLFSALYCGKHCVCCNVNHCRNFAAFSNRQ